jgi:hypothetical protein
LDDVRNAASDALASLGAKVETSTVGTTLSGKTGWRLMSFFGENVTIELSPDDDVVHVNVTSDQSRGQLLDLSRRTQKNVGTILNAMETRLSS